MDQGFATLIAGVLLAVPGLLAYLEARRTKKVVQDVHAQVVTLNEGTIGTFAAEDETRRIEKIPHDERNATEQRHLDQAPDPEPPIGPSR